MGKHLGEVLPAQHLHMALELSRMVEQGQQRETRFCSMLNQARTKRKSRVFETCMAVSRLGKKSLTCLYLRDLTDRIQIERELQKTNTFLHNIIRSSVDGIVVVDPKGVPLIFNEGAERILGYKAEEIIGNPENFRRFYPPEVAAEMMRRMRSDEYGPPDKLNTTRITFINKNGEEVPVNFSAAIIRERGQEVGSVGIFSDLREILKVHQELEASPIPTGAGGKDRLPGPAWPPGWPTKSTIPWPASSSTPSCWPGTGAGSPSPGERRGHHQPDHALPADRQPPAGLQPPVPGAEEAVRRQRHHPPLCGTDQPPGLFPQHQDHPASGTRVCRRSSGTRASSSRSSPTCSSTPPTP